MKKSTKIFLLLFLLTAVPAVVLFPYLSASVGLNENGFVLNFSLQGYIALALVVISGVIAIILYFKFLKTLSISKLLFFSTLPFTLIYGALLYMVASLNSLNTQTANAVKTLLNITENGYNAILWAVLLTILYITVLFIVYLFVTKPVYRIEKVLKRLGDGKIKQRKLKVGTSKQFSQIGHALVKINNNYHNIQTNDVFDKVKIPKILQNVLHEGELLKLQNGQVVNLEGFLVCAWINGEKKVKHNLDILKLRLNELAPLAKKFNGIVAQNITDYLMVFFFKSEDALDYAHALCRCVKIKNKHHKAKTDVNVCVDSLTAQCYLDKEGNLLCNEENLKFAEKIIDFAKYIHAMLVFSSDVLDNLPSNYFLKYRYVGNLPLQKSLNLFESLEVYGKNKLNMLEKDRTSFEQGVLFFEEGQKDRARVIFENIIRKNEEDRASFVYFNQCRN